MLKRKILLLSDAPTTSSGLGKICRELALRINKMPEFEVATLGTGMLVSKHLPFQQYLCGPLDGMAPINLREVWHDFAGEEYGILLAIWNPGWLSWLTNPDLLPDGQMKHWLKYQDPFEKWGYFPVDAEGPNGRLPWDFATIIKGFDRILSYTKWQADITERTLARAPFNRPGETAHLPHGVDTSIFYPRNRKLARQQFLFMVTKQIDKPIDEKRFLIGCVATNTPRKNWALVFEVCQELLRRGMDVGLWAHTDVLKKNWNLEALAAEYGMQGRVIPTDTKLSDEDMAWALSACDVCIAPGLGEGFGYPIFESLACGVPCIHGDYGGAAEFLPAEYKVTPKSFYDDGFFDCKRPTFDILEWADRVIAVNGQQAKLPDELRWANVWPRWEDWLREGLK